MRPFFETPDLPPIPPSDSATLKRAAGELVDMGVENDHRIAVYVDLTTGDEFTSKVFPWHGAKSVAATLDASRGSKSREVSGRVRPKVAV